MEKFFEEIKLKSKDGHDLIDAIEFLYKNAEYNLNNYIKEEEKDKGWQFNPETLKQLGIGSIKMQIPLTVWTNIKFFEFNSFLTNVIRTINFILEFKLKYYDKKKFSKQITISNYLSLQNKKFNESDILYQYLEKEYVSWIKRVNKLRNLVVHEKIIRQMEGNHNVTVQLKGEEFVSETKKKFGVKEYEIEDLDKYIEETFANLNRFVEGFFPELI
jgi:hypothetical protein